MTIVELPARPVAFARMIAKIAYCFAFVGGHIKRLECAWGHAWGQVFQYNRGWVRFGIVESEAGIGLRDYET